MSNPGFLSSFTSLFNTAGNGKSPSSSSSSSNNGYLERKRSVFGNGMPSSMRKDPPSSLDDGGAWTLPYSYYKGSDNQQHGQYPPSRKPGTGNNYSNYESSATVNITDQLNESTSTLVPAQGRPSINLSSSVSFPSTAYPPLRHTWKRIRAWCDTHYSELADTLNWAATEAQLEDLELTIGFTLPSAVRDSYLCYDGQELESNISCSDGLFFGLPLLSLDQIAEEWRFWRTVDEDPASGASTEVKSWMNSCPSGWIRSQYSCRGWIPLISDRVGNYIGVDLSPNPQGGGSPGQVILFGRDFDTKIVLWRGEGEGGWGRFLQFVAEEFEGGELWTLEDNHSTDSNDEEDTIGYESYFSNGGAGASQGGGDRGGEGSVGFRLRGEYKGWPVLEAWADRSMRCWDEVGMSVGQPSWQTDPPVVQIDQEAEVSTEEANGTSDNAATGHSHPLEETTDSAISSTLSPPVLSNRASKNKQKRREEAAATTTNNNNWPSNEDGAASRTGATTPRGQRKSPPAPAAPLDLPTIDDVRAAHAAALASQRKSGTYHYDSGRSRPPAGMGGMGMGMGVASTAITSRYTSRYAHRRTSRSRDVEINMEGRQQDALELENRSSQDMYNAGRRTSSLSGMDQGRASQSKSSSFESSRGSFSGSTSQQDGRILYSAGAAGSEQTKENLIDSASATDLNATGTRAIDTISSNLTSEPFVSSPLATQNPVFASSLDQTATIEAPPTIGAAATSLVAS